VDGQEEINRILSDVFGRHDQRPDKDKLIDFIIRKQEQIMASISDLSTDVAALTAAVGTLSSVGTTIDPADQATLDSADAAVQAATTAVTNFVTPPAPAATPAPTDGTTA
jgi:cell division septum initiation protein DivIVA